VKITHCGHATVLVETGGARILIDPGLFTPGWEDLTDLTAVFVTHQHPDHLDVKRLPTLLERNPEATLYTEPETSNTLDLSPQVITAGQTITVGSATVTGVGSIHAEIHPDIPRIGNTGVLITADGEPTFFHPGDAYAETPEGVDVLGMPLNAPWAKLSETVTFGRAVQPRVLFPIHDYLLRPETRGFYLANVKNLLTEGIEVTDLNGAGAATF
jgi:L-ascorbate metabolism protein UlaG (beta-lactamase superfamily)